MIEIDVQPGGRVLVTDGEGRRLLFWDGFWYSDPAEFAKMLQAVYDQGRSDGFSESDAL